MDTTKTHDGVNLLGMFLVVLIFAAAIIYGTISLSAQDALWFLKGFGQTPDRVVVYAEGVKKEYRQGDHGYDVLAEAIRQSLDRGVARQSGIGLSEQSLADAYTKYLAVEAFFFSPVKLHAWFNTSNPTQMLFPITGRHSEVSVVFLGMEGKYLTNGPVLKDLSPLRDALRDLGYLRE